MTTLAKQANLALDLTGKVAAVSGGTQVNLFSLTVEILPHKG